MTRALPARARTTLRLCCRALVSMTARIDPLTAGHLRVTVGRVVGEARELPLEGEQEGADLAVAVLHQVYFRDALLGGVAVVDLFTIDEQDQVRILFERSRFAQVRHHRPLVLA